MPRRDTILKHRYTCWITQDAYAQQEVWSRTLTYEGVQIAITETRHLKYYNLFIPGPKFSWVAFEVTSGFPISYGSDPDYAVEAAKRLVVTRKRDLLNAIDAVNEIYGVANEQDQREDHRECREDRRDTRLVARVES